MTDEGLAGGAAPENGLRRLAWGMAVSVLVNLGVWGFTARAVRQGEARPVDPVEIIRLILPPVSRPATPKMPPKAAVPLKPPRTVPLRPRSFTAPRPVLRPRPVRTPSPETQPRPPSTPQFTHNRVLISPAPTPTPAMALRGGNAAPGVPSSTQGSGEGTREILPAPPPPLPPVPDPGPPHHDTSTPLPTPQPPPPVTPQPPPSAPTPIGPTTEAQVGRLVLPEIPDYLQQDDYKSSVRVTVEIDAQGVPTRVTLDNSSGNADVDKRVIAALKRSGYKPALQNGRPIAGIKRFRFDFEVR